MDELTIFLIVWTIAGIVSMWAAGVTLRRPRKSPCDTCKWLKYKERHATVRYYCGPRGGFMHAPEYCCEYERRDEGGSED